MLHSMYTPNMSRFLIWTERELGGLKDGWGLSRIFTEIDAQGAVIREIGLNEVGEVVHRHPGLPSRAEYGVFDSAKIGAADSDDVGSQEFDRLWLA